MRAALMHRAARLSAALLILLATGCAHLPSASDCLGQDLVLLRGDLHCHSAYSKDANQSVETIIGHVAAAGWDFFALTDHNTRNHYKSAAFAQPNPQGIIVIPGYELTLKNGHFNFYGITDFVEKLAFADGAEIRRFFDTLEAAGALTQVNHPFDPKYPDRYGMDFEFGAVELWNGVWDDADNQTLAWWQQALSSGRRVRLVGGSDAHKVGAERSPVNCVYARIRDAPSILAALRQGHSYVSESARSANIAFCCPGGVMGDAVPYTRRGAFALQVDHAAEGSRVRVITDRGVEIEKETRGGSLRLRVPMQRRRFYRVEVVRSTGVPEALSNPIYVE